MSRSQRENVVWSPNYIAHFWEILVAESNADVRILIGSWYVAAYAHAQYKFVEKHAAKNDQCDVGRPQVGMHSQLPHFLVYLFIYTDGLPHHHPILLQANLRQL